MFAVVPIAILMMSLMVAFVGTAVETSRANVADLDVFRARAAAQNAANLAISELWGDFSKATGGSEQLWELRTHLNKQGIADSAAQTIGGLGQSVAVAVAPSSRLHNLGLAVNERGRPEIDGVEIERLDITRTDEFNSTSIIIDVDAVTRTGVDGSSRERRASIQEIFTIAPPEWEGLDFALLANNINCLLCHTQIDNAERFYNNDLSLTGTFESVKVGSLDAIHFRSDPDSSVAGVMLIGGDALLGDGKSIDDWSAFNLSGAKANYGGMIHNIVEDIFGNAQTDALTLFDAASPNTAANMYLDFHSYADQTNYELPESFPSPFPDNGGIDPITGSPDPTLAGNRIVDDSEFFATTGGASGVVSGGKISVINDENKKTKKISSKRDVQEMRAGTDSSIAGVTDGSVYLHGTKDNPLILDGDVAIDGDVIISGYVKGEGSIHARGNVYVTSDILYADGGGANRTFGTAADGTKNSLAIAAGGNIVVGDMYRPAWGSGKSATGKKNGSFNFTMDEIAIFNRMEWMKTQPTLVGKSVKTQTDVKVSWYDQKVKEYYWDDVKQYEWVKTGRKTKKTKYKYIWESNGLPGEYEVKTKKKVVDYVYYVDEKKKVETGTKKVKKSRWVKTGKKLKKETPVYEWIAPQHANPKYDPDHMPRYYAFGEKTPVPIFNKQGYFDPASEHWVSDERAGEWDKSKLTYAEPNKKNDPILYNADGSPKAVVSIIGPTDGWIHDKELEQVINEDLALGSGDHKEIEINATLYSSNSIIGTVPDRASAHTNGELIVNGGIVAADVGLLAPNGTRVNYDGRGARILSITADSGLEISRRLSAPRMHP